MSRTIITSDLYEKIKKITNSHKDDYKAIKKFGVSERTVRSIRNSSDFNDYKNKTYTYSKKNSLNDIDSINKMLDREMSRIKYEDEPKGNAIVTTLFVAVVAIFVVGILIFLANR